jgi:hypothetical protein
MSRAPDEITRYILACLDADLVQSAVALIGEVGRPLASPTDANRPLGLPQPAAARA